MNRFLCTKVFDGRIYNIKKIINRFVTYTYLQDGIVRFHCSQQTIVKCWHQKAENKWSNFQGSRLRKTRFSFVVGRAFTSIKKKKKLAGQNLTLHPAVSRLTLRRCLTSLMAQKTILIWLGTFIQERGWRNPKREDKKGGEVAYKTGCTLFNVDVSKGRATNFNQFVACIHPPLPSNKIGVPLLDFVFRGGDGDIQVTIWRRTHHSWQCNPLLYRVDPYISLAVNKNRKEFLSGSPFSQIIKMLSHSEHVVSFAPCTCVQASTLHPGTKTAYRFTNSELSCLLYDSCLEDKFQTEYIVLSGQKIKTQFIKYVAGTQREETWRVFFLCLR